MALQNYAQIQLFVNGIPLLQIVSAELQSQSGRQPINLLREGLSGFTSGTGSCTLQVSYRVPNSGFEFDFQEAMVDHIDVPIQFTLADKTYSGTGKIMENSISQSTDDAVEGTFSWQGPFQKFE